MTIQELIDELKKYPGSMKIETTVNLEFRPVYRHAGICKNAGLAWIRGEEFRQALDKWIDDSEIPKTLRASLAEAIVAECAPTLRVSELDDGDYRYYGEDVPEFMFIPINS
jgi:hypothetical protein